MSEFRLSRYTGGRIRRGDIHGKYTRKIQYMHAKRDAIDVMKDAKVTEAGMMHACSALCEVGYR